MAFLGGIVAGLVAGWLAGLGMKGEAMGFSSIPFLGFSVGWGGWLLKLLGIWPVAGMMGSITVAFVGAVISVWITRLLKKA